MRQSYHSGQFGRSAFIGSKIAEAIVIDVLGSFYCNAVFSSLIVIIRGTKSQISSEFNSIENEFPVAPSLVSSMCDGSLNVR